MVKKRGPLRAKTNTQKRGESTAQGKHLLGHIQSLLTEVLSFTAPADVLTSRYFKIHAQLGLRERGLIAEAVFAVLRRKLEFEAFAKLLLAEHDARQMGSRDRCATRSLAILGLAATAGLALVMPLARPEEVAWLEKLRTFERQTLPWSVRSNLPDWIRASLEQRFQSSQLEALAQALLESAPLDLRVNRLKVSREQLLDYLASHHPDWGAQATPFAPDGIRLANKPALSNTTWFAQGWTEVQDEGSQLLACLLAPRRGEMVVDFCAGAGGKTLALGAMMRNTGRLYAIDIVARRLAKLKPRLARSGLSNVHPVLINSEQDSKLKRIAGKVDRVLVDAPCSGLGTLRRNPDLKWRQTPESLAELVTKQQAILHAAAKLLKPGGRLVYATCSLLQQENQAIIEQFLATHPAFQRIPIQEVLATSSIPLAMTQDFELWPHLHNTDGFYAAVLVLSK
jgi:16S rRNA (cytosine967-C5)-methyltransferase